MPRNLCNSNTLKIVSVNRYVPVWTNIFLFLPALLALTQKHNPVLVKFGVLGLFVATVSLLHHLYATDELDPKDLCKKKLPDQPKTEKSLSVLDVALANIWGFIALYLVLTSPVKSWTLKGTVLLLFVIALFFFILGAKGNGVAARYYKKLGRNNLKSQENIMEYDLYHGFWHTILGMSLFVVVFLYMKPA